MGQNACLPEKVLPRGGPTPSSRIFAEDGLDAFLRPVGVAEKFKCPCGSSRSESMPLRADDGKSMTASAAATHPLAVGDLLRYRRLGTVATYRVCNGFDDLVELEVIEGPGLRAGQRFRFTQDAVAKMKRVGAAASLP
jgi:hypothetical protein